MDLLEKLTQAWGPSGNEEEISALIKSEIEPYVDEIQTDALGNLAAHKKGSGKRLMLAAHMDEIGIVVTFIDKEGFLRFSAVGGLEVKQLPGRRVRFKNGTTGVIGCEEEAFNKKPSMNKLYIDIGAKSCSEAEKLVSIGDMAVFEGAFYKRDDVIVSKALDNRTGCYILIETAKRMQDTDNDVYFVFTVQEEVGLRGARTVSFGIEPDYAVAVDVTDTGDTPHAPFMAVKLGEGAAVKVMDRSVLCHRDVRERLSEIAAEKNICCQAEIMNDGGTDAGAIHTSKAGVKTGGVSLPVRYIHSPSELASEKDIESCIKLLTAYAESKL